MKRAFRRFMGNIYMFIESVKMAVANIMANRMRSFLTILGILIGVVLVDIPRVVKAYKALKQ